MTSKTSKTKDKKAKKNKKPITNVEKPGLTGAAGQLSPEILDALVFGYLSALEEPMAWQLEEFPVENQDFETDPLFENTAADNLSSEVAGQPLGLAFETAGREDIIGDVTSCIFAAFDRRGIPITSSTKPSDVMAVGNWIGVGRAILVCVVSRYPQFGPVAKPSRLRPFYNKPLITLARSIRSSIAKRT